VNTGFTLAHTPIAGSQECNLNGQGQDPGAGNDYTIAGTAITFTTAPPINSKIWCDYRY
jgi:hypothetical protein